MTMGTASTMTSASRGAGIHAARAPRRFRQRIRVTRSDGQPTPAGRIVDMVWEDLKPRDFLTAASFDNAITTVLAHRRLDQCAACTSSPWHDAPACR